MTTLSTSLTRGESNVLTIDASEYIGIKHRASAGAREAVNTILGRLIAAIPTSVHPDVRAALLEALLGDLEDKENATWTQWPEETTCLALAAVKALSRNPIGSESLSQPKNINTILHHTALPLPPAPSPFSSPPSAPSSPSALEALKVIANLLVLRPDSRKWAAGMGIGAVVSRDLSRMDETTLCVERVFLIARIGFLIAVDGGKAVKGMIEENVVESAVAMLTSLTPSPEHFMALTELLKFIHAVVSHASNHISQDTDTWSDRFDIILAPLLRLLYSLPMLDLAPPLTQVLHALLLVPFDAGKREVWLSKSGTKFATPALATSPSRSIKSLFGSLSTSDTPRRSFDSGSLSPVPVDDSAALPRRLLGIMQAWFEIHVPYGTDIDGEQLRRSGVDVEADLPPLTLLLVKVCNGDALIKQAIRDTILPNDLDRSAEVGPLEQRRGLLGDSLRVLTSSTHTQAQAAMEEFFWALANWDATKLMADIGYGNAAGLMFRKGIEAPSSSRAQPAASITELSDEPMSPNPFGSTEPVSTRHPISALENEKQSQLENMTEEEKENEAERLFVLFERMERNRVISTGPPGGHGVDMMRKALEEGKGEEWERFEEKKRLREMEEDERRDEEEALKEIQQLKARQRRA